MSFVRACEGHIKATGMAMVDSARMKVLPFSGANEGGRSSMSFQESLLTQTTIPKLRFGVCGDAVFPFIRDVFDLALPKAALP